MARKTRQQSTNPNKILIIFLVIFIITTIANFVWAITRMQSLHKDTGNWEAKQKELAGVKQEAEWYKYQRDELLAAIGDAELAKRIDLNSWRENRRAFMKGEKFKNEEGDKEFREYVKNVLESNLGGFNDSYKDKFAELPGSLNAQLAELKDKNAKEAKKNEDQQKEFVALQKKYNSDRDAIVKEFKDGNQKVFDERSKATKEMTELININQEQAKAFAEREDDFNAKLTSKDERIKMLETKLKGLEAPSKTAKQKKDDKVDQ
jgi:hypothetical protein